MAHMVRAVHDATVTPFATGAVTSQPFANGTLSVASAPGTMSDASFSTVDS
jgi:hypothetical protein